MLTRRINAANAFSAEKFVENQLRKAAFEPVPRRYKGKSLPEFVVIDLMEKDRQKAELKKLKQWEEWGKQ